MITVMGARGHVGNKIAHFLLDDGLPVRVLGRSARTLDDLAERGAEVQECDLLDTTRLAELLHEGSALFAMVPSNPFTENYSAEQDRFGASIASAISVSKVPTVVTLSSLGADRLDAPGVIGALHRQEARLRALTGVRVTALRPVSFFENLLAAVDQLVQQGSHVDSIVSDLPIPMISTSDIAAAAAHALVDPDWDGYVVRELLGERDVSYIEATTILGRHLGITDPRYVQLPYADMASVLTTIGFSLEYSHHYVDMTRAFNSGELTEPVPRTSANTTATSIEAFAASLSVAGSPS
ncbi:NAD-dependent epimerase/dehydratase family protein [Rhodococcus sp. PAMC28707]|uniref:NmrA family NAD(P)-binding protein n=1 Tax=unclassified Rhodococcus (in: high G+C Gram-positive bacteria) TaxID=192944 RepID=UPI00109E2B08|nr:MULTISPECIES: NAD(P)H-binding protein [unclassified Rhodococcus (in: high G+C Gram-positive bacteria)]QCB51381.1 NAD-dependent epimerase/dehydratase family protein [Rhodococcus sp. PAMC28705]QCB60451.1 NAD-dependent epimerase/dehydratase family protein [Rhodococcus sp. PAMC28707]